MEQEEQPLNPRRTLAVARGPVTDSPAPGEVLRPFPLRLIATGLALVILFLSSFTVWSTLAPIEGAVVSPGIVSVASHRKQVQHLEGGIVESIHVRDGDRVSAGQLLVKLSDVRPAAQLRQLEGQYLEARAIVARLLAERDNSAEIEFPKDLLARSDDASVKSVLSGQRNILISRQTLERDKHSVLEHKIAQAQEQIAGIKGQIEAKNRQRSLILEELASVDKAIAQKLVPEANALRLRQRLAESEGELSAFQADIARLEQSILEMRLQKSEARAARITQITEELRTQRASLFDLTQRLVAARDVLGRTSIVSPIDGIVVNLQIHTQDGVLAAGQSVLDVVPTEDDLVIHAFVHPDDIDEVRAGMAADARLTSLSRRNRIPLEGIVSDLSADRLTDLDSGRDYYLARIELNSDVAESEKANMVAGMGAEVFIRTGARTLLDYLLSPITSSLQLGLREH